MQPQDQNYQDDTQNGQQPINDVPDLSAEPLQPAPTSDDNQGQPPLTPFVDGDQNQVVDEATGQLSPQPLQPDFSGSQDLAEPPIQPSADTTTDADTSYQPLSSPDQQSSDFQPVTDEPKPFNPSEFEAVDNPQDNQALSQEQPVDSDMASEGGVPVFEETEEAPSPDQTVEDIATQHEQPPVVVEAPAATTQEPAERVSLTDHSSFTPQEPQAIANTTAATAEEKDNIYTEICGEIIKEQEQIIGTLAVEQANYVEGLSVDPVTYHCTVTGDGSKVIDDLIEQYRDFFGHAAVEVCKEAASRFLARLPAEELPTSLR